MTDFATLLQQGNAWLFVPSAILLGALHGLEPGHSKTMMAAFDKGITHGECSWILADNRAMNRILEGYGADCYKTYRVYEKKLA